MSSATRFPAFFVIVTMVPGIVWAQVSGGRIDWRPGARIERTIDKSGSDTIRIPLAAHQFVRLEAIQKGLDFAATLRDPEGRVLIQADSVNDRYGPETVVAITNSAGGYTLQVMAGDPADLPARYELRCVELRSSQPSDEEIVAAHRAYAEAEQLRIQHTAETRRAAIAKLESSLEFFNESGDRYMEGLALFSLGTAISESGDYRKAQPLFQNASEVFHSLGATHEEADAVNSEAGTFDVLGEPRQALRSYQQALDLFRTTGDGAREAILFSNIGWSKTRLPIGRLRSMTTRNRLNSCENGRTSLCRLTRWPTSGSLTGSSATWIRPNHSSTTPSPCGSGSAIGVAKRPRSVRSPTFISARTSPTRRFQFSTEL